MPELDAQTRPLDRVAQVGATPLSRTMVPNAYGAVWCDAEEGTYTADHDACAILGLPACGAMSEQIIRDILEKIAPALGGTQRYYTFRNHLGHVARARLIPSGGLATVILVDDLNDITNRMFLLKASEREYRELFENAPYGIHRTSLDGKPMQANPALVRLNGYSSEADMMDGMKELSIRAMSTRIATGSSVASLSAMAKWWISFPRPIATALASESGSASRHGWFATRLETPDTWRGRW